MQLILNEDDLKKGFDFIVEAVSKDEDAKAKIRQALEEAVAQWS